jgi:hypothetical protein
MSQAAAVEGPGIALLTRGGLAPAVAAAPTHARAAFLAQLAALLHARHATGSSTGGALAQVRWVDGSPPGAWLPHGAEQDAGRTSPARDRAALARIASELLAGPDCPPGPASLMRRAARAPGAAPLPVEWVLAIRRAFPGIPTPAPWDAGSPMLYGRARRLVLLLLDSGPLPAGNGRWQGRSPDAGDLVVALAGRHAERLVLPLQPATGLALTAHDAFRPPLEIGPELIGNLRTHAIEAAVILDADAIPIDRVEIMVVGSRPGVDHDLAQLTDHVRRIVHAGA